MPKRIRLVLQEPGSSPEVKKRITTRRKSSVFKQNSCAIERFRLLDLPPEVLRLIIRSILGCTGPGYIPAEQARAVIPLAATCQLLRELCASSLRALHVYFYPDRSGRFFRGEHSSSLMSILRLSRSNLLRIELNCSTMAIYCEWFKNLGVLCPQIEELSISCVPFLFGTYEELLKIIGQRLKVFRSTGKGGLWGNETLKLLIELCPALEKLLLVGGLKLRPEVIDMLAEAYGDQMTELGLFISEIRVAAAAEMILNRFSKLEVLQVEESHAYPSYRLSFDCFHAYEKARSVLNITTNMDMEEARNGGEKKCSHCSQGRLRFLSAELRTLRGLDMQALCLAAGSHLITLNLSGMAGLTDNVLRMIGEHCKNLRAIDFADNPQLTDAGVELLCRGVGSNLRYLRFSDRSLRNVRYSRMASRITSRSLQSVVRYCSRLNFLDVSSILELSDEDVCLIARRLRRSLRALRICQSAMVTVVSSRALALHCPNALLIVKCFGHLEPLWSDQSVAMRIRVTTERDCFCSRFPEWTETWRMERFASISEGGGLTHGGNLMSGVPPQSFAC